MSSTLGGNIGPRCFRVKAKSARAAWTFSRVSRSRAAPRRFGVVTLVRRGGQGVRPRRRGPRGARARARRQLWISGSPTAWALSRGAPQRGASSWGSSPSRACTSATWTVTFASQDMVAEASFRLTLDVGHAHMTEEAGASATVRAFAGDLVNVHLEGMRKDRHDHLLPHEGDLDLAAVVSALREVGYAGPANLRALPPCAHGRGRREERDRFFPSPRAAVADRRDRRDLCSRARRSGREAVLRASRSRRPVSRRRTDRRRVVFVAPWRMCDGSPVAE